MILLLDNYDSFTYNLLDYLLQLGVQCEVLRNDEICAQEVKARNYKGIVLSPGPCTPADAGILMDVIAQNYEQVPMLGICLGHQAIGTFFGAQLHKAAVPVHGKTNDIEFIDHNMAVNLPSPCKVMRYHSLILHVDNNPYLQVTAQNKAGEIMAIAHTKLPIWGYQFHPESVLTQAGLTMLANWLKYCVKN